MIMSYVNEAKRDKKHLMVSDKNTIVLLDDREAAAPSLFSGVVIYSEEGGKPIGTYSDSWALSSFQPFYGEVTIGHF